MDVFGFWDSLGALSEHWVLVILYLLLIVSLSGVPNTGFGLQNMFHDDPALFELYGAKGFLNSPAIFVQGVMAMFCTLVVTVSSALTEIAARNASGAEIPSPLLPELMLGIVQLALILVLVLVFFGCFSVSDQVGQVREGSTTGRISAAEKLRVIIGAGAGFALGLGVLFAAAWLETHIPFEPGTQTVVAMMLPAAAVTYVGFIYRRLISGVAVVMLLGLFVVLYAGINLFPEWAHPLVLASLVALMVISNNVIPWFRGLQAPLKFEIPGIVQADGTNHYRDMLDLSTFFQIVDDDEPATAPPPDDGAKTSSDIGTAEAQAAEAIETKSSDTTLQDTGDKLNPLVPLSAWRAESGEAKPKLVLIATSGGAYRASFWTALVLDELAKLEAAGEIPGFCRNVRLITGASGGMVGGAYFTAMMPEDGTPPPPLLDQIEDDILETQRNPDYTYVRRFPLPRDSLSAVCQQLIQGDIPGLFKAGYREMDRGKVLEEQWRTINVSFGKMRAQEAAGKRPSILFSPMLAETGQPLLISNLDLNEIRPDDSDEAVEFFDWFKHSRDSFKLNTAVRLNASFPYIAPASALPTKPYRRVVDAGYYDNYGVDLAVAYLARPKIRDWVVANTSGVVLLQLRAFPFTPPGLADPSPVARALQFLTTPIEGFGTARGSTMKSRNSQSFRRLESMYYLKAGQGFLRTIIFGVDSKTSLSWYMPQRELDEMRGPDGWENEGNQRAVAQLKDFWHRDLAATAPSGPS